MLCGKMRHLRGFVAHVFEIASSREGATPKQSNRSFGSQLQNLAGCLYPQRWTSEKGLFNSYVLALVF